MFFFKRKIKDLAVDQLDMLLGRVDYAITKQHVLDSVAAARIISNPFPYILLENVFDEAAYEALLYLVQHDDLFQAEEGGDAYTIFRYPQPALDVSAEVKSFIDFMALELNPALSNALLNKFSEYLLEWASQLRDRGIYLKSPESIIQTKVHPYEEPRSLQDGMVSQFEIMRRTRDFAISPHGHPIKELLIGIFPIVPDNSMKEYGTDLFSIKPGCSPILDTHEFFYVPRDTLEFAGRTFYLRNSAFIMLNADGGIHAYNPPPKSRDRDYIYTTLLIGDSSIAPPAKISSQWYAR